MAAPIFGGQGATASGVTALTVPLPAAVSPGNPMICVVESENETVAAPSGWTSASVSPQSTSTTQLSLFLRRYQAGDADPTLAAPVDHLVARVMYIDDDGSVGDPLTPNAASGGVQTTTSASVSVPGLSPGTTVSDCLVFMFACNGTDLGIAQFSGWANASLSGVVELFEGNTTAGSGGGFGVALGVKAAAGVVSATTATLVTASRQGLMCLAFALVASTVVPRPRTVLRAVQRASLY